MPVSLLLLSSSFLLFYTKGIGAQLMTLTPVTADQSLSHLFSLFASFAPDTRSGCCPVVYSPTLLNTMDWAVLLFIDVADVQKSCHLVHIPLLFMSASQPPKCQSVQLLLSSLFVIISNPFLFYCECSPGHTSSVVIRRLSVLGTVGRASECVIVNLDERFCPYLMTCCLS